MSLPLAARRKRFRSGRDEFCRAEPRSLAVGGSRRSAFQAFGRLASQKAALYAARRRRDYPGTGPYRLCDPGQTIDTEHPRMKKAIIRAGLETEDLVERSHVEERYEEALALQPREVDQSSSKAKGMAQAAALKKKRPNLPKRARPRRTRAAGGAWRICPRPSRNTPRTPARPRPTTSWARPCRWPARPTRPTSAIFAVLLMRAIHQNRDKALKFYEQKIHILKKKQAKTLQGARSSVEDAKKLEDCRDDGGLSSKGVEAERARRRKKTLSSTSVRNPCVRS